MSLMFQGAVDDGAIISDGLIARWKFDGDLLDSVGGYHGGVVGSGVTTTDTGVEIVGTNTGVTFGDLPDLVSGNDKQFSVTAIVRVNSTNVFKIFSKSADGGCGVSQREFFFDTNEERKIRIRVYSSLTTTSFTEKQTSAVLTLGTDYHLCWVYDGTVDASVGFGRTTLYIDGAEAAMVWGPKQGTLSYIRNGTAAFGVGANFQNATTVCGNYAPNGKHADLRFYNRLLTPAEAISITSGTG